jgi:hypothetical protein
VYEFRTKVKFINLFRGKNCLVCEFAQRGKLINLFKGKNCVRVSRIMETKVLILGSLFLDEPQKSILY